VRFLTTRAFLLNVAFAGLGMEAHNVNRSLVLGVLLGGSMMIDASRETLWKMNNSGKSFEEAMESLEKKKARKDKN
ncbi:Chaperone protein dnaJ 72-like protein, partial [Drosera capensis]